MFLSLSQMVSYVMCSILLYRFLIIAFFLTLSGPQFLQLFFNDKNYLKRNYRNELRYRPIIIIAFFHLNKICVGMDFIDFFCMCLLFLFAMFPK